MKKTITALLLSLCLLSSGQTVTSKDGKTYTAVKTERKKTEPTNTGKIYVDSKGNSYPIMKTDSAFFVIRTSQKTGNIYKQYLKLN